MTRLTIQSIGSDRHELLSSERRRVALAVLSEEDPPVSVERLARKIAAEESESLQRVKISLHHHHLPKMDDCGVLDYDPVDNTVRAYSGLHLSTPGPPE